MVLAYRELLKESVERTVKTIAWMLANANTTSKRQHFDALSKPKEEELSDMSDIEAWNVA